MRYQDWNSRLSDFIEESRNKPFKRGVHDCTFFAAKAISAMRQDIDNLGGEFKGEYKNKNEAIKLLKKEGFNNLEGLATSKLGEPLHNINYAKTGDCVLIKYEDQEALGIVIGNNAATAGKEGLYFFDCKHWEKAWGV